MSNDSVPQDTNPPQPRWQPLLAIDRRTIGVLIEKGKTTPNAYPMSLSAVATGCNQKSNRSPVMQLQVEDVEESLDRIRGLGGVGLIEGYGRVNKYRHYMYDWLGVDKVEIAVMAELLLRGAQTMGELRGRAARMEPIRDLAQLRPLVQSLIDKGLVVSLTPEGRGQVVTHALYQPREMERLLKQYQAAAPDPATTPAATRSTRSPTSAVSDSPDSPMAASSPVPMSAPAVVPPTGREFPPQVVQELRREMEELRAEVAQLRSDLAETTTAMERTSDDLQRLKDELGV